MINVNDFKKAGFEEVIEYICDECHYDDFCVKCIRCQKYISEEDEFYCNGGEHLCIDCYEELKNKG